jgi:hypothetical protein
MQLKFIRGKHHTNKSLLLLSLAAFAQVKLLQQIKPLRLVMQWRPIAKLPRHHMAVPTADATAMLALMERGLTEVAAALPVVRHGTDPLARTRHGGATLLDVARAHRLRSLMRTMGCG